MKKPTRPSTFTWRLLVLTTRTTKYKLDNTGELFDDTISHLKFSEVTFFWYNLIPLKLVPGKLLGFPFVSSKKNQKGHIYQLSVPRKNPVWQTRNGKDNWFCNISFAKSTSTLPFTELALQYGWQENNKL